MANTKISDLTAASALTGTEEMAGVQGGGNVKITPNQINTFLNPIKSNPEGITFASIDCDNIDSGSIQIVSGDSTNAPTATSGDRFMIITTEESLAVVRQCAIQVAGTDSGDIHVRSRNVGTWGSWAIVNT